MQYVKECLQLLYWIYFKPRTLIRHVWEICPEITNPYADNIYRRSAEAWANPRLKRYDDQCWWLAALVPIVVVFLYMLLAEGVSRLVAGTDILHVGWWLGSLFLLGWLLGQLIVRASRRKLGEKTALLVLIAAMVLMLASAFLGKHLIADSLLREAAALGVLVGAAAGVAFGVALGVRRSYPHHHCAAALSLATGAAVDALPQARACPSCPPPALPAAPVRPAYLSAPAVPARPHR
jgi:hypothetical protein